MPRCAVRNVLYSLTPTDHPPALPKFHPGPCIKQLDWVCRYCNPMPGLEGLSAISPVGSVNVAVDLQVPSKIQRLAGNTRSSLESSCGTLAGLIEASHFDSPETAIPLGGYGMLDSPPSLRPIVMVPSGLSTVSATHDACWYATTPAALAEATTVPSLVVIEPSGFRYLFGVAGSLE